MGRGYSLNRVAPFIVLLAAAMWGSSGTFARFLSAYGLSYLAIAELRIGFSALALIIFVAIYNRSLLKIRLRDFWFFIFTGIIGTTMTSFLYFVNMSLTSLSVAAILLYTSPIFVTIFSRFIFKEPLTRRRVIALICAFVGCALVSGIATGHANISVVGLFIGIASGLGYAIYTIASRLVIERGYHSFTVIVWTFIFASVGGAVVIDWGNVVSVMIAAPSSIPLAIVGSLVGGGIPYALYTAMLPHMETSTASIIATFEPVMATILGAVVFSEIPTVSHIVGILLVIFAVVLLSTSAQSPKMLTEDDVGGQAMAEKADPALPEE